MEAASAVLRGRGRRRGTSYGRSERRFAALMLTPSLVVIAIVAAYPIGYAIWLSLNQYSVRVAGLSRFVGFDNYTAALKSSDFWSATGTTFLFTGISVTLELIIGLGMALAMHQAFRGRAILRTVVLVPWAILTVVTAITWRTIFEPNLGLAPVVLGKLGLPGANTVWLGEQGYALAVMILGDVWKTAPFMALLLLAGLQVIPEDVYEAAKVDGASTWQRFTRITLPLLKPAILVALIFRTLDALRIFDLPFVLTQGANGTTTLSILSYNEFSQDRLLGQGSALAVLTFLIVMAVSFIYIRTVGGNIRSLAEE
ncbi:MAG TPA: sugar ABC transporter permease [Thermoleophilaceae bacterium]|jgi:multiple sugar transport system permease protein|nr:sugar ABC transporter permease [Thermoleophilaceae bacterium]